MRLDEKKFEMGVCVADPELFEFSIFHLRAAISKHAFPNPNAIAITESAAKRLFGDEDPIGKTITAESNHHGGERTITAVLKDVSHNSTLQFDYVSTGGLRPQARNTFGKIGYQPMAGVQSIRIFLLREGAGPKGAVCKASRIY